MGRIAPAAGGSTPPPPSHRLLYAFIARARLLFAAIPLALIVVGVRAATWLAPESTFRRLPSLDPSVLSSFIAASIFVIALLLNGVMADYKGAFVGPPGAAAGLHHLGVGCANLPRPPRP